MATVRYRALRAPACIALLALAACARQGEGEMSWARSALERNAAFEVVAADEQSRTFTVRMKDTGELRVVRADQLIRSEEHTSELQSRGHLVCRLLLEKKKEDSSGPWIN